MLCISNSVASTRSLYFSSWIHLWHFLLGMMAPGMLFSFQASSLDLADEKKKKKKKKSTRNMQYKIIFVTDVVEIENYINNLGIIGSSPLR